jgi:carbon dioxide concentrating mechanism protein CcmL
MRSEDDEKSEDRNPKSERSPKSEFRRSGRGFVGLFGLRASDFFRVSDFGFRIYRAPMRLGTVIGRVTLSRSVPALTGGRWLVVSPFSREQFQSGSEMKPVVSAEPSVVVYDNLGGGVGQTIGFVEGREAAQPFEQPTPIDAISAVLVDEIFYSPYTK